MTKQKDLAGLIRKGLEAENVLESGNSFLEQIDGRYYVCALGAALVGKFGSADEAYSIVEGESEIRVSLESMELTIIPDRVGIAANLLEIDFDLAEEIDKTHMLGAPAALITERLEQGSFPY